MISYVITQKPMSGFQISEQLGFFGVQEINKSNRKAQRKRIDDILQQMRKLHEDLNSALSYRAEAPSIHAPQDAANLVMYDMAALETEHLRTILLDTRNKVKEIITIYQGSVNTAQVRVGELFRPALIENAPAIIVVHNHPSGDPTPSPDDVAITRAIVQAGKLLDVDVLDHIVIGNGRFVSLKERGLGFDG